MFNCFHNIFFFWHKIFFLNTKTCEIDNGIKHFFCVEKKFRITYANSYSNLFVYVCLPLFDIRLCFNSKFIDINFFVFIFHFLQVWFQNRRMKDKRQRIAVSWPFAAVYADPTFAASLLQAAASSVSLPYGYGPNPMIPQMQIAPPTEQYSNYGYRYSPYGLPQRNTINSSSPSIYTGSMANIYSAYSPPTSSTSQSPLSLSPIESEQEFQLNQRITSISSSTHDTNNNNCDILNSKKPKLFQPYKLEKQH